MGIRLTTVSTSFILFVASISSSAQDGVPRYKLAVGQEIQYQGSSDSHFDAGGGIHFEAAWTLWVIGHHERGGWRVVERHTVTYRKMDAPGRVQTALTSRGPIGRFDLFPDGRIEGDDSDSNAVCPLLPKEAADKTWHRDSPTFDYSVLPDSAPGEFVFHYDDHRTSNGYYLVKHSGTLYFDRQRGLLRSGTENWEQGYPRRSKGPGTLTLKSVQTMDAAFIAQLARESDVYFKARAEYDHALSAAGKDAAKAAAILREAKHELTSVRASITLPLLTEPLDEILATHDRTAKAIEQALEDQARRIAAVMNKPAANWELKDLSGKTHQLSDYRGKVVLLDFWYRACGYCIDAMPQLKQVADDFRNDPMAVLGMNIDDDPKDAAFIADKLGLNYPTLLAKGRDVVPAAYGVTGYPTLIVIDPAGIVRDIRVGYSPHMREELDQAVRTLLPPKAGSKPS